jgi:hypothetical protein
LSPGATVTVTLPSPTTTVGTGGLPGADTVAAVNVNVAVPVCVPLVAVTAHVPGAVAVSDESVIAHPLLVVA